MRAGSNQALLHRLGSLGFRVSGLGFRGNPFTLFGARCLTMWERKAVEPAPTTSYSSRRMVALILVTGLSLFNFGYNSANIGGVLLYLDSSQTACSQKAICLSSPLMKGVLVSSCLVGAVLGALFAGTLAAQQGPRTTLLMNNVFFIVGSISSALAPGILSLILSRCILGLGVGSASAITHVYIGEVVPAERRGEHGALLVVLGTGGILVANLVSWCMAEHWRWVFAFGAVPAMLQLLWGSVIMPESPHWKARLQPGRCLCRKCQDADSPECIANSEAPCFMESSGAWFNLLKSVRTGRAVPPLIIGGGLHVLAQATGINVVIYYGPKMLTLVGFASSTAVFVSTTISLFQMGSTILLARLVDRLGRKPMSFIGLSCMLVSLCGIAFSYLLPPSHRAASWLALISCFAFRVAFSVSLGPLPYIIAAEVFPEDIRAPGVSLCLAVKWVANFVVSLTWLPLAEAQI